MLHLTAPTGLAVKSHLICVLGHLPQFSPCFDEWVPERSLHNKDTTNPIQPIAGARQKEVVDNIIRKFLINSIIYYLII